MRHELIGLGIDTGGAFLMLALALWVWRVRPENRLNRAFALLVSSLSLSLLLFNISWAFYFVDDTGILRDTVFAAAGALLAVTAVLLVHLERHIPRPLAPGRRAVPAWFPFLIPLLHLGTFVMGFAYIPDDVAAATGESPSATDVLAGAGATLYAMAALFLVMRLANRYAQSAPHEDHLRWQCATIAIALGAFPLFSAGLTVIEVPLPGAVTRPLDILKLIPITFAALPWIVAGARHDGRLAVATGLVLLSIILAAVVASAAFGTIAALNSGTNGILRLLGTVLLAYTILRHQLFDIDLKIKWTISRGTVAGVFVATFFVISELVAGVLSERVGMVIGILTTGLLVFAISPLQRMADRLSDVAMPHVHDTDEYRTVRKRAVYQAAIESAQRDGIISDRERDVLATLADELGLSARDVLQLERATTDPSG